MDKEMIERCTLAAHNFNIANNPNINFDDMPDSYKDTWRRLTIAIVKAMREPTEKMIKVGDALDAILTSQGFKGAECGVLWNAMCNAIIGEE